MFYRDGQPEPPTPWYKRKWIVIKFKWRDIKYFPRQVKEFLQRLWAWLPVLWKDRDFDYHFMFEILRFKLKRMAFHLRDHNILLYAERYARQIDYAVFLIDRILENDYCKEEYAAHEEKWGETIWNFKTIPNSTNLELDLHTEKSRKEGLDEQEREEHLAIHYLAEERLQKDLDRLFRHIRKYHNRWWD